jgi:beta-lactamase regulating signal transducer with metallopeptidase domain
MLEALGEAALRTLLLAAIAQLGLWLLRIRQAQLLLIVWTVVLAASLIMPALQWATPIRLPFVPELPNATLIGAADPQLQAFVPRASGAALGADSHIAATIWLWLEAVYLLVSSILLLRLAVGVALSLRLLAKATPVRLEWAADARVRISRDIAAPVTVANVILLPADIVTWSSAMQQAVLAHERAHVARWDFAMLLIAQANRALFWFSPLSWWLPRRLAMLAELASDDHALAVTGDRSGYAEALLEMGRRSSRLLHGLAMARPATLITRIERVLSGCVRPKPVSLVRQAILAIGAAGLSIAAASPQIESIPPPGPIKIAEQQVPPPPLEAGPSPAAPTVERTPEPRLLPPSRPKVASQAALQSAPPTPRSPPDTQVAAQSVTHRITRHARPVTPSRTTRQANRVVNEPGVLAPALKAEAVNYADKSQRTMGASDLTNSGARVTGEVGQAPSSQDEDHLPASEPPLLKQIDEQTCSGAYLPGPWGRGNFAWLNLVRAKFFRKADGTAWLTFSLGTRTPVDLPIRVTGTEIEFTGDGNTIYTMLPKGSNHLTGTTQSPYGTIDVACGGSDAHLFHQKS